MQILKYVSLFSILFISACSGISQNNGAVSTAPTPISKLSKANDITSNSALYTYDYQLIAIDQAGHELNLAASDVDLTKASAVFPPAIALILNARGVNDPYPVYVLRAVNQSGDVPQVYYEAPVFNNAMELSGSVTALWLLIKKEIKSSGSPDYKISRKLWESLLLIAQRAGCTNGDTTAECLQKLNTAETLDQLNAAMQPAVPTFSVVLDDAMNLRFVPVESNELLLNERAALPDSVEGQTLTMEASFFNPYAPEGFFVPTTWEKRNSTTGSFEPGACAAVSTCTETLGYADYAPDGVQFRAIVGTGARQGTLNLFSNIADQISVTPASVTLSAVGGVGFKQNHWAVVKLNDSFSNQLDSQPLLYSLISGPAGAAILTDPNNTTVHYLAWIPSTAVATPTSISVQVREANGVATQSLTLTISAISADNLPGLAADYPATTIEEGVETNLPAIDVVDIDGDALDPVTCTGWPGRIYNYGNYNAAPSGMKLISSTPVSVSEQQVVYSITPSHYEFEGTFYPYGPPPASRTLILSCSTSYKTVAQNTVPLHGALRGDGQAVAQFNVNINLNNTSKFPDFTPTGTTQTLAATQNTAVPLIQVTSNNNLSVPANSNYENYYVNNRTYGDNYQFCNWVTNVIRYSTLGAYHGPSYAPVDSTGANGYLRFSGDMLTFNGIPSVQSAATCQISIQAYNRQGMTRESPVFSVQVTDVNNALTATGNIPLVEIGEGQPLSLRFFEPSYYTKYNNTGAYFPGLFTDPDHGYSYESGDPNDCRNLKSYNFASYAQFLSTGLDQRNTTGYQVVSDNLPHVRVSGLTAYQNNKGGPPPQNINPVDYMQLTGDQITFTASGATLTPSASSNGTRQSVTYSVDFYTQDRATDAASAACYDPFENSATARDGQGVPNTMSTYKGRSVKNTVQIKVYDTPTRPTIDSDDSTYTLAEGNLDGTELTFDVLLSNGDNYPISGTLACVDPQTSESGPFLIETVTPAGGNSVFPTAQLTQYRFRVALNSDANYTAGGNGSTPGKSYDCTFKVTGTSTLHGINAPSTALYSSAGVTLKVANTNRPPLGMGIRIGTSGSYDCTDHCSDLVYDIDLADTAQKTNPLNLSFLVADQDDGDRYKYTLAFGPLSDASDFASFSTAISPNPGMLKFDFTACPTGNQTKEISYNVKARQLKIGSTSQYVSNNASDPNTTVNRTVTLRIKNAGDSSLQCPL